MTKKIKNAVLYVEMDECKEGHYIHDVFEDINKNMVRDIGQKWDLSDPEVVGREYCRMNDLDVVRVFKDGEGDDERGLIEAVKFCQKNAETIDSFVVMGHIGTFRPYAYPLMALGIEVESLFGEVYGLNDLNTEYDDFESLWEFCRRCGGFTDESSN